jgi:hypothetical protein
MNQKIFLSVFLFLIILTVAAALSCKDTQDTTTTIVFPSSGVSYSLQVQPLFQQRCAISGCHDSSTKKAGLDLTYPSYSALVNYNSIHFIYTAGNGSQSVLYQILAGKSIPPNLPMPPVGVPQLNPNQITGILTWINEGANGYN